MIDELAECSLTKCSSSHGSHSVEQMDSVFESDQKFRDEIMQLKSSAHENSIKKQKMVLVLNKRKRRTWSAEEETLLVDLLYEMNDSGWMVDTGHKSGYLVYIEKELVKKLPNCNLKADPHIKSKVKVMKKYLTFILEIQRCGSGFGWDDDKKMVTGEKEIFMEWAKSRKGAACLWNKPMVHYDKLVEIYAPNLAKGNKVKGARDESQNEDNADVALDELEVDTQPVDECVSVSNNRGTHVTTLTSLRQSLKRKVAEAKFDQLATAMTRALEAQSEKNSTTEEKHMQLIRVVSNMSELTPRQVVVAIRSISQDPTKVNVFLGLPENLRTIFVQEELTDKGL